MEGTATTLMSVVISTVLFMAAIVGGNTQDSSPPTLAHVSNGKKSEKY